MKAITVRQPWASAIASGAKTTENRSWRTHYRGPLLIHAGAGWSLRGALSGHVLGALGDDGVHGARAARSRVLAVVDLTDCHPSDGCCTPWGENRYRDSTGRLTTEVWHWSLESIRPLPEPITARGRLGLWTPDRDLLAHVDMQVGVT